MSQNHCAVQGCKMSIFNKPTGVLFYPCPTSIEMKNKWLHALRNRCALLDWSRSRICSKHFEHKYFDSQKKLKDNAVPTLFPVTSKLHKNHEHTATKNKIDRIMSKLTQSELIADIKNNLKRVKEPANFDNLITDDLRCRPDASIEAQLWLLIKKQDHLNNRLLEHIVQNKKHIEVLQKNMDDSKSSKKDVDQSMETYKYIVKCLQEKLATLEEQIEILTAVESR
ncbi:uncharacterized protein LOC124536870 [Vanessa cardui]|uniref:uncharacterized protein LOC124536870 n=1 Tax=Vanessa cardui TaxID=171605 RepID=UPI001F138B46|nr:uncharacterized protein LOC124536870 [Vanessa cardui]